MNLINNKGISYRRIARLAGVNLNTIHRANKKCTVHSVLYLPFLLTPKKYQFKVNLRLINNIL